MLENLTVPLILAAVFTLGGYILTKAGRYAEPLGDVLGGLFVIIAVLAVLMALAEVGVRGGAALARPAVLRTAF